MEKTASWKIGKNKFLHARIDGKLKFKVGYEYGNVS
jgi:hypothetical protein